MLHALSHIAAIGILLCIFLIFFSMYKRPKRPLKTQILCPRTKRVLMDFELLHGHCTSCKSHNASANKSVMEAGVKKCEDNIQSQLHESNRVSR
jgi:hypothetical protein